MNPVSHDLTGRMPLDAWLEHGPAPGDPGGRRTALRDMAWNYGQARGLVAVRLGSGVVTLAAAGLAALNDATTAAWWLLAAAVAQLVVGAAARRGRAVRGIPRTDPSMARGPETVRSGIGLALAMAAVLSLLLAVVTEAMVDAWRVDLATVLALHVLVVAEVFCVFALPARFVEHARRDLRASLLADADRYAAFDRMAREWTDPRGFREFGPL